MAVRTNKRKMKNLKHEKFTNTRYCSNGKLIVWHLFIILVFKPSIYVLHRNNEECDRIANILCKYFIFS